MLLVFYYNEIIPIFLVKVRHLHVSIHIEFPF